VFQTRANVLAHLRRVHHVQEDQLRKNVLTRKMPDLNKLIEECFGRQTGTIDNEDFKKKPVSSLLFIQ
jgi:hypothetical protein